MPSKCEFELNNPDGVYFSGDTINATVILTTTSTKEIKGVYIPQKVKTNVLMTS